MLLLGMDGCYGNLLGCVHHWDTVQLQVMSVPRPTGRHELAANLLCDYHFEMPDDPSEEDLGQERHFIFMAACWKKWLGAPLTIALI